jgi:hypothetical protein
MKKWTPASRIKGLEFSSDLPTRNDSDVNILDNGVSIAGPSQLYKYATTDDGERVRLLDNGLWEKISPTVLKNAVSNTNLPAVIASSFESPEGQFAFRKIQWGMSEREVRDSELGDPAVELDGVLVYETRIAGLSCQSVYVFVQKRCIRSKYAFTERHSNDNAYIGDYEKVKALLLEKYGRPVTKFGNQSDQIWLSDTYLDDPNDWGMAVSAGHLVYQCEWETPDTAIALVLRGDNFEITLAVEYSSKLLGHIEDAEIRRKELDNL